MSIIGYLTPLEAFIKRLLLFARPQSHFTRLLLLCVSSVSNSFLVLQVINMLNAVQENSPVNVVQVLEKVIVSGPFVFNTLSTIC